jgi:hypothetical protein
MRVDGFSRWLPMLVVEGFGRLWGEPLISSSVGKFVSCRRALARERAPSQSTRMDRPISSAFGVVIAKFEHLAQVRPMRPLFRAVAGAAAILSLGSCSYVYDLLVVGINGRLAFIVDPASDQTASCINGIHVSADRGGPLAERAPGDDAALVRNGGVYWWKDFEVGHCLNPFPVFYGAKLEGKPFDYGDGSRGVEAKPLRRNVIYQVSTSGSGSGYGGGWFRIDQDGHIENWRSDPTPPDLDECGYDRDSLSYDPSNCRADAANQTAG